MVRRAVKDKACVCNSGWGGRAVERDVDGGSCRIGERPAVAGCGLLAPRDARGRRGSKRRPAAADLSGSFILPPCHRSRSVAAQEDRSDLPVPPGCG